MDVILLQRIEKLGQMGQVVKVKPGFARNYLLPQKKALRATDANRARFEKQRAQLEAINLSRREEAQKISGKVEGLTVVIIRQAGETGHLYGSVSPRDVAAAATAGGVTIERSQVLMDRPIKMLGLHPVRVALHPEVVVTITANVAKSEEEAEIQKKAGGFVPPTTEEQPSLDEVLAQADEAAAGEGEPAEAEPKAEEAAEAKPKKKAKAEKADEEPAAEKPKREKKSKAKKAESDE
jgi:large subunit ribosomal protein L9